ncbi:septation protein SepH [Brachybacterium saurashtrense]|uniref:DUF3071 domain-containing protein n=1 Tax=Brachybacterium saurashtrense TaxID=556288 RepID=A0A345YM30_9MICO|nr:septation protein SepH [Brachybacterium saurashtrense]AXK44982.1 DUF3071 domain-containing protein [Brachybacterium saurashtrense]RRR21666.1 DUF3071 domain-containing protein [Brachybacterium saurashtrense]
MRELELDGIHDDGEHVLLVDSDGERYTLRIDRALRAAVRSDRPALNMIQAADAAPLRPREIQAMLRSGRSAEDIAEASDIPLEHVRRYEGPVLAEREWTAQRARTFPVGRGGPALLDVVTERLAAREATGDTAWDAWRRQDGTWTLELTFSAGGRTRQAHWVADIDNRSVSPVDDEARWISDEDAPPEPSRGRGRLQAVKSAVYDLEADGSLDGSPTPSSRARTWTPRRPAADSHPSTIDEDELDALNARRGLRPVPRQEGPATVWSGLEDAATEETETSADAVPEPGQAPQDGTLTGPDQEAALEHSTGAATQDDDAEEREATAWPAEEDTAPATPQDDPAEVPEDAPTPAAQDTVDLTPLPGFDEEERSSSSEEDAPAPAPEKKPRPRSKRASMPSWDEIVFGSKHD